MVETERQWAVGEWASIDGSSDACRVVDHLELWGRTVVDVWVPSKGTVMRLPSDRLQRLDECGSESPAYEISFTAAAARIADALERDALVAPLEGSVIPLPHQIYALSRAMAGDRVRYLLADEVGLGKTIEAGLILRELKVRGLVKRVLVVAPTGIATQWVQEMRTHFSEQFTLVVPGDFAAIRKITRLADEANIWRMYDQVVCPLDSVKPMERRRGWSEEQVGAYNRERFEDLLSAGWDLVIIDEAHRLGGSTEQVARFKLGEALGQASPYLLLLSATPHQGKTDAFRRLMAFLDPEAFIDETSVHQENVAPFVIRTEKRRTIDAEGNPLFMPRRTQLIPVHWGVANMDQRMLYEAVTNYVRDGYNQAIKEKKTAVGFLMILMQRLVTSSSSAIRQALERRLEALGLPEGQLSLFPEDVGANWAYLDGQDQMDLLLKTRLNSLKNEKAEVELLLSAARQCESKGPDRKAELLLEQVQMLQREENDPDLKVLIFTEFIPTQVMLRQFLTHRGFSVVSLNGSLGMEERAAVQRAFAKEAQVLISTEAGGEGLNLQFCHVVLNYDLPWNPMKLEQRIGRVDRIGQTHAVRAINFALEDTVELRVLEVLEQKLQIILQEFGVDKLSDVLDSEDGDVDFDAVFTQAVLHPDEAEERANALAESIRRKAEATRDGARIFGEPGFLDPTLAQRFAEHQIPFWTERMTLAWLMGHQHDGASVRTRNVGFTVKWPDPEDEQDVVFTRQDANDDPAAIHLTLEDTRIRALVTQIAHWVPGRPLVAVELDGISNKTSGIWSLWRVSISTYDGKSQRMLPLFIDDEGRILLPTARRVWDILIEKDLNECPLQPVSVASGLPEDIFKRTRQLAESQGHAVFDELQQKHNQRVEREMRKGQQSFEARDRVVRRVGLEQVKQYRLRELAKDRDYWQLRMDELKHAMPDLSPVLILRIARLGELT